MCVAWSSSLQAALIFRFEWGFGGKYSSLRWHLILHHVESSAVDRDILVFLKNSHEVVRL
jgi:hypothetical protein